MIRVVDVTHHYGVRQVNLEIQAGELVAVLEPNDGQDDSAQCDCWRAVADEWICGDRRAAASSVGGR